MTTNESLARAKALIAYTTLLLAFPIVAVFATSLSGHPPSLSLALAVVFPSFYAVAALIVLFLIVALAEWWTA